jgi:hypothetical protein
MEYDMAWKPSRTYTAWSGMKQRCLNPNFRQWKDYGGRGIAVCDRWMTYKNFLGDMGECPPGLRLERINNDGGYAPNNCRWATAKEQQRNQRVTRKVTIDGMVYIAADLADKSGLKTDTIVVRAKRGLSLKRVLSRKHRVFTDGLALGGIANSERQKAKTHCPKGHRYNRKNTYVNAQGWRKCRICRRLGMMKS